MPLIRERLVGHCRMTHGVLWALGALHHDTPCDWGLQQLHCRHCSGQLVVSSARAVAPGALCGSLAAPPAHTAVADEASRALIAWVKACASMSIVRSLCVAGSARCHLREALATAGFYCRCRTLHAPVRGGAALDAAAATLGLREFCAALSVLVSGLLSGGLCVMAVGCWGRCRWRYACSLTDRFGLATRAVACVSGGSGDG